MNAKLYPLMAGVLLAVFGLGLMTPPRAQASDLGKVLLGVAAGAVLYSILADNDRDNDHNRVYIVRYWDRDHRRYAYCERYWDRGRNNWAYRDRHDYGYDRPDAPARFGARTVEDPWHQPQVDYRPQNGPHGQVKPEYRPQWKAQAAQPARERSNGRPAFQGMGNGRR